MVVDLFDELMRSSGDAPAPSSSSGSDLLGVTLVRRDERMAATGEVSTTGTGLVRREGAIVPVDAPTYATTSTGAPRPEPDEAAVTAQPAGEAGGLSPLVLVALGLAAWWAFA